ncbi:MAG TPA: hypothetical protein VKK61_02640, partial [Tepidisphaeraceae bacterium]|nr:hypothetical protein [Tepidisphaeraceae bacterium]
ATMHDSLFAIDANTGAILWQDNFLQLGDPRVATVLSPAVTAGVTTIPGGGSASGENALINTNDIEPELGILSSPVIDPSTNRIYLLANTQERRNDTTTTSTPSDTGTDWHFVQRLWSLSLSDGSVAIAANNSDAAEPTPTSGGKLVGDTILNPTGSNTFPSFGNFNGYKYVDGPFIKASGDNQTSSSNLDGWAVNPNDTSSIFAGTTPSAQRYVAFNGVISANRTALSLINGNIYLGTASHGDMGPYYGWVLGYSASTLANTAAFVTTPTFEPVGVTSGDAGSFNAQAGVWGAGAAIATDGTYLYFSTGNGAFNPQAGNFSSTYVSTDTGPAGSTNVQLPLDGNYGDTVMKLAIDSGANQSNINFSTGVVRNPNGTYDPDGGYNTNGFGLKPVDYFAPSNTVVLNSQDADLGSGAVMVVPSTVTSTLAGHVGDPMLVEVGKEGRVYLLDQDNLGGFNPNFNNAHVTVNSGGGVTRNPSNAVPAIGDDRVLGEATGLGASFSIPSFYMNGSVPTVLIDGQQNPNRAFNILTLQNTSSIPSVTTVRIGQTSVNFGSGSAHSTTSAISSNAGANGIVWNTSILQTSTDALLAFNAASFTGGATVSPIYSSQTNAARDQLTGGVTNATGTKFSEATVFNGMVYVGTGGGSGTSGGGHQLGTIVGYGLLNSFLTTAGAHQFDAPTALTAQRVAGGVQLNWSRNSAGLETLYEIQSSTNGSGFSTLAYVNNGTTTFTDTSGAHAIAYRVRAVSGPSLTGFTNTALLPPQVVSGNFPWQTAPNKVQFTLDQNMTAGAFSTDNLTLTNANGSVPAVQSVSYDAPSKTVTFLLAKNSAGLIPDGNYTATLNAGSGASSASGAGTGADFTFSFFSLAGDSDHDRDVDNADFGTFFSHFGTASGATFSQGDFDYDGDVDNADFAIFFSNFGKTLAPPAQQTATIKIAATSVGNSKTNVLSDRAAHTNDLLRGVGL